MAVQPLIRVPRNVDLEIQSETFCAEEGCGWGIPTKHDPYLKGFTNVELARFHALGTGHRTVHKTTMEFLPFAFLHPLKERDE